MKNHIYDAKTPTVNYNSVDPIEIEQMVQVFLIPIIGIMIAILLLILELLLDLFLKKMNRISQRADLKNIQRIFYKTPLSFVRILK